LSLEGKRRKETGSSLAKTPRRAMGVGAGTGETASCCTIALPGGRARGAIDRLEQVIGEGLRILGGDLPCGHLEARADRGGQLFGHREGQAGLRANRLHQRVLVRGFGARARASVFLSKRTG
jgi:hypothetical protein